MKSSKRNTYNIGIETSFSCHPGPVWNTLSLFNRRYLVAEIAVCRETLLVRKFVLAMHILPSSSLAVAKAANPANSKTNHMAYNLSVAERKLERCGTGVDRAGDIYTHTQQLSTCLFEA